MRAGRVVSMMVLLCAGAAQAATEYAIQLHRPVKVGHRRHAVLIHTEKLQIQLQPPGEAAQGEEENRKLVFAAVQKVTEVDGVGRPLGYECVVEKCEATDSKGKRKILEKGAVLSVSREEGREVYRIDGKPAPQETVEALELFFELGGTGPTEDQLFGSPNPQLLGSEWPANSEAAAKRLSGFGGSLKAEDLKGTVSLAGLKAEGPVECLEVKATLETASFVPPGCPPNVKPERSALAVKYTGLYPKNAAFGKAKDALSMTFTFSGHLEADGKTVSMTVSGEIVLEGRYTELPEQDMEPEAEPEQE